MTQQNNQLEKESKSEIILKAKESIIEILADNLVKEFKGVIKIADLANEIAFTVQEQLLHKQFFNSLELTAKQMEELESVLEPSIKDGISRYFRKNKETLVKQKDSFKTSINNFTDLCLATVSDEINRGVILNGTIEKVDVSNDKTNRVQIAYSKVSGAITAPSRIIAVNQNAIEEISKDFANSFAEEAKTITEDTINFD